MDAWQRLVTKFDKEDAPDIDDYHAPLSKAKKTLAGWQARAKDQEETAKKWITEKEAEFEGLNTYLKLPDKGAQAKLNRVKAFIESLQKNAPAASAAKILEYTTSASQMQSTWGKKLDEERAAPALKTVVELFAGTPLEGKDEKVQKEALKQLQTELKTDGCYTEEPKGEYAEATHAAIKQWQGKRDLPADGRLNGPSWAATSLGKLDVAAIETQLAEMAKKAEEEAAKVAAATPKKPSSGASKKKAAPKEEPGFWRKVGNTITSPFKKDDPKKKK